MLQTLDTFIKVGKVDAFGKTKQNPNRQRRRKTPPSPPLSTNSDPVNSTNIITPKRKKMFSTLILTSTTSTEWDNIKFAHEVPKHDQECTYCRDCVMHPKVINALNTKRYIPVSGNMNWEYVRSKLILNASSMSSIVSNNWFCSFDQAITNKLCSAVIERGPDVYYNSPNSKYPIRKWNPNVFTSDKFDFAPEKYRISQVSDRMEDYMQKMTKNITRGKRHEGDAMIAFEKGNPMKHKVIDDFKPIWQRKPLETSSVTATNTTGNYAASTMIFSNSNVFEGQLGVTPDGITYCGLVVEYKCPNVLDARKLSYYNDQIQSALHILEMDKGVLFQYDVKTEKYLLQDVPIEKNWVNDCQCAVDEWIVQYNEKLDSLLNCKFLDNVLNAK